MRAFGLPLENRTLLIILAAFLPVVLLWGFSNTGLLRHAAWEPEGLRRFWLFCVLCTLWFGAWIWMRPAAPANRGRARIVLDERPAAILSEWSSTARWLQRFFMLPKADTTACIWKSSKVTWTLMAGWWTRPLK